jgi:murein DD-endopeptidase MepM/ murein hydrolase activator NlpD
MPEAAEVKERNGGPLPGRQRGDGGAHAFGDLGRRRRLVGPEIGCDGLGAVATPAARTLAQRAPAEVDADAGQPRCEAIVVAQAVQAEQRGEHGLLGGVGGHLGVAGDSPADGREHAVVALHQSGERATITAARGGYQGGIGLEPGHRSHGAPDGRPGHPGADAALMRAFRTVEVRWTTCASDACTSPGPAGSSAPRSRRS